LLTAWGLASVIGWGWTLVVLLAGCPVGVAVLRTASRGAVGELRTAAQQGIAPSGASRYASRFAAGVLLLIPGLWSDLAAVLVLVPGTRRWMLSRLPTSGVVSARTWSTQWGSGDVVPGHVVVRPAGSPGEGEPAGGSRELPR